MEKMKEKWMTWCIGLLMCFSMQATVYADSSLSADDLIQFYSGGGTSELIQTQINFKEEVTQHTTGMVEFFMLLFRLVLMAVILVAVGYGIYLVVGMIFDRFK